MRRPVAIATVSFALLLAACGGGGGGEPAAVVDAQGVSPTPNAALIQAAVEATQAASTARFTVETVVSTGDADATTKAQGAANLVTGDVRFAIDAPTEPDAADAADDVAVVDGVEVSADVEVATEDEAAAEVEAAGDAEATDATLVEITEVLIVADTAFVLLPGGVDGSGSEEWLRLDADPSGDLAPAFEGRGYVAPPRLDVTTFLDLAAGTAGSVRVGRTETVGGVTATRYEVTAAGDLATVFGLADGAFGDSLTAAVSIWIDGTMRIRRILVEAESDATSVHADVALTDFGHAFDATPPEEWRGVGASEASQLAMASGVLERTGTPIEVLTGQELLARAADRAEAAGSANLLLSETIGLEDGTRTNLVGAGAIDFATGDMRLTFAASTLGLEPPADVEDDVVDMLYVGESAYMRFPAWAVSGMAPEEGVWVRQDLTGATGDDSDALGGVAGGQGLQYLDLARVAQDPVERGPVEYRHGVAATRYDTTIAHADAFAMGVAGVAPEDGGPATMRVWIDGDGLVRRIEVVADLVGGRSRWAMELWDFGEDPALVPPAAWIDAADAGAATTTRFSEVGVATGPPPTSPTDPDDGPGYIVINN
jgi:hypothetical protein